MAKPKKKTVKKTVTPNYRPTAGYALIEPIEIEKQTAAGIVLPDSHNEKSSRGKIISLGAFPKTDSGQEVKPEFKVGDTVVYKKWGGDEVQIGVAGQEIIFVNRIRYDYTYKAYIIIKYNIIEF